MTDPSELLGIVYRFALVGEPVSVVPLTGGHINDSFLISVNHLPDSTRFLLQRVNDRVFTNPVHVVENVIRVTDHLRTSLEKENVTDLTRRVLTPVPTLSKDFYHLDSRGGHWRMFVFIEGTTAYQSPQSAVHAYRAAQAFGVFQKRLGNFEGPRLHETIPGFHNTPRRLNRLERAIKADIFDRCKSARGEIEFARANEGLTRMLLDPYDNGVIPEHVVHNDAKIANLLFDVVTEEALCVIDLDTVMPGLALYDFGDMARSMSSTGLEDEIGSGHSLLDRDLFEATARGYLDGTEDFLSREERGLLVESAKLIIYEQGLRFLTDYLDGDRYYRINRSGQNLDRCRVQFALLDELTRAEPDLKRRIQQFDPGKT